jgi:hypothetical protein
VYSGHDDSLLVLLDCPSALCLLSVSPSARLVIINNPLLITAQFHLDILFIYLFILNVIAFDVISLGCCWGQKAEMSKYGRYIGDLARDVSGQVYAVSDEVLFIKGFVYGGTGPGKIYKFVSRLIYSTFIFYQTYFVYHSIF